MPIGESLKMLKRSELFRELYDKKQPLYGSFNSKYIQRFDVINSLINRRFQQNNGKESYDKLLKRHLNSTLFRQHKL